MHQQKAGCRSLLVYDRETVVLDKDVSRERGLG